MSREDCLGRWLDQAPPRDLFWLLKAGLDDPCIQVLSTLRPAAIGLLRSYLHRLLIAQALPRGVPSRLLEFLGRVIELQYACARPPETQLLHWLMSDLSIERLLPCDLSKNMRDWLRNASEATQRMLFVDLKRRHRRGEAFPVPIPERNLFFGRLLTFFSDSPSEFYPALPPPDPRPRPAAPPPNPSPAYRPSPWIAGVSYRSQGSDNRQLVLEQPPAHGAAAGTPFPAYPAAVVDQPQQPPRPALGLQPPDHSATAVSPTPASQRPSDCRPAAEGALAGPWGSAAVVFRRSGLEELAVSEYSEKGAEGSGVAQCAVLDPVCLETAASILLGDGEEGFSQIEESFGGTPSGLKTSPR